MKKDAIADGDVAALQQQMVAAMRNEEGKMMNEKVIQVLVPTLTAAMTGGAMNREGVWTQGKARG